MGKPDSQLFKYDRAGNVAAPQSLCYAGRCKIGLLLSCSHRKRSRALLAISLESHTSWASSGLLHSDSMQGEQPILCMTASCCGPWCFDQMG